MSTPDWRTLPSLATLRAFDATARAQSFAGAARALNVTHAAVAQQVRALEAQLGIALTRRQGRTIALTAQGQRLAAALAEGFQRISDGVETLRVAEQQRGLRVTTTEGLAEPVIMPSLAAFWQRHPEVPVTLVPDDRVLDLAAEGFDLGVRAAAAEGRWPGVEATLLTHCDFVVAGAPSLFDRDLPDLAAKPWLIHPTEFERDILRRIGLDADAVTRVDVGAPALERPAARLGYGFMICSEIIVRRDLELGELRRVPLTAALPRVGYYAVTPPGPRRPAVTVFIDWLKELFAPDREAPLRRRLTARPTEG